MTRYPEAIEREEGKLPGPNIGSADATAAPPSAPLAHQSEKRPRLKHLGGSEHDRFNIDLANAVLQTCWITSPEQRADLVSGIGNALAAIGPKDELEGMLAAQMVAAHHASMECFRRAMVPNQSIPGRELNLNQANKASRTFTTLLEALNRHRGKGQQRVRVEHVHVYPGGQAIVGNVEGRGAGANIENQGQSHAPADAYQPSLDSPMRSEDAERPPLPRSRNAKRPMPNARRHKSRSTDG